MKHIYLLSLLLALPLISFASDDEEGDDHYSPLDHPNHVALFGGYSIDLHDRVGPKLA